MGDNKLSDSTIEILINKAFDMLNYSYAPYSHFKVGASLLGKDGRIYGGCNIENAAYGPSNCAERTAVFKAVSEGCKEFSAIAIVGGQNGNVNDFCPPCGVCRQVMREFCESSEFKIILAKSVDDYKIFSLEELLPLGFGADDLKK